MLWLQASNSILFETLPVKAQNDKICGMTILALPGYAFGYKKRMKKKEQYLLDVQCSTNKKLATTKDTAEHR